MKLFIIGAAALLFSATMSVAAVVQPSTALPGFISAGTCAASRTAHIDCIGMVLDNGVHPNPRATDSNDSAGALNANGFFGYSTWQDVTASSPLAFTGAGSNFGTFSFSGAANFVYALVVKASSGYNAFLLSGTSASGAHWDTLGLLNRGSNMPAMSHLTLYRARSITDVPLPASAMLLLGGLLVLGGLRARRRA